MKVMYSLIGGLIGYLIAPLSLAGFGLPLYLNLSFSIQKRLGSIFLCLAILCILCNAYLRYYRDVHGYGASIFPAVFSLCGIPALFLLRLGSGVWMTLSVVAILIMDFVGQALLGDLIFILRDQFGRRRAA